MLRSHVVILLGILLYSMYKIWVFVRRELSQKKSNSEFFGLVETSMGSQLAVPKETAKVYDKMRAHLFRRYKQSLGLDSDAEFADSQPQASWLRRLPTATSETLFKALVRRTVDVIPAARIMQQEMGHKNFLYQKSLISERQWRRVVEAQKAVTAELEFIAAESARVGQKYEGSVVFQVAAQQLQKG